MVAPQKIYQMLGNESLWHVAKRCDSVLSAGSVPYAVCGGVAVCLHGYQRNTIDLDLVIRSSDGSVVKKLLSDAGFVWDSENAEFQSLEGIPVQFLISGQKAGKGSEVSVPDPVGESNVEQLDGLIVVRLSRLIEMKLACGTGNLRRTHKDFADVVELIALRNLDGSFARFLHPSLRPTFRKLVRNAQATQDDETE